MKQIIYALCAAFIALTASAANAEQARSDGAYLYENCNALASASENASNLNPNDTIKIMYCVGYLTAFHSALQRIHRDYRRQFAHYGNMKDEAFVKGWFAAQLLLGPDVCFPSKILPKTMAMIISKHGREHPNELTSDMFTFAGFAFMEAYPGGRKCDSDSD